MKERWNAKTNWKQVAAECQSIDECIEMSHTHTHTHTGILCSHKKWDLAIHNNMEWPKRYNAKWNKSAWERQIPYGFTHMWNLKNNRDL